MVVFIEKGNIFKIKNIKNYAHGCNCAGAMGKGIAQTFRQKFPEMYEEYKFLCKNGDFKLGDVFAYQYQDGIIFNLGTQLTWKTPVNYEALSTSLRKMLEIASFNKITNIALPKIGAGLGSGNWNIIRNIIVELAKKNDGINLFIIEEYEDIDLII